MGVLVPENKGFHSWVTLAWARYLRTALPTESFLQSSSFRGIRHAPWLLDSTRPKCIPAVFSLPLHIPGIFLNKILILLILPWGLLLGGAKLHTCSCCCLHRALRKAPWSLPVLTLAPHSNTETKPLETITSYTCSV